MTYSKFNCSWLSGRGVWSVARRVARIWKRGGFFERVRKVQTTLTRIFIVLESVPHGLSENWDGISWIARKFKRFFRPQNWWSPKKIKGLHRNWVWFFCQSRKFKRFFNPKSGSLQKKKKKKGFHPKLTFIFRPESEFQTLFHTDSRCLLHNFGTQFPLGGGGCFQFFSKNRPKK